MALGRSLGLMSSQINRQQPIVRSTSRVTTVPRSGAVTPKAPDPTAISKGMFETSLTGAQGAMAQPFSLAGLGKSPYAQDFNKQRQENIDATYNMFARRQEPIFTQQQKDFQQQMANRGIQGGNELYNRNYGAMQAAQNDARLQAMDAARLAGGNEQSRLYDMASNARQQALNEYMLGRSQPLQETNQLLGLWQGLKAPTQSVSGGGSGRRSSGGSSKTSSYNPLAGMDLSSLYTTPQQSMPSQPSLLQQGLYSFGAPLATKAISSGVDYLGKNIGGWLGNLFGGSNSAYDEAAATGWY